MNVIVTNANRPKRKPTNGAGGNEAGIPGKPTQTALAADATDAAPVDGTLDRLLKLVPAEVIAGYTALLSITASVDNDSVKFAIPSALAACTVLIFLILRRAGKQQSPPVKPVKLQYVFSVLAFWVWALAIRDPLDKFGYATPSWLPAFGCVLVPLFGAYLIDATDDAPGAK